MHDSSHSLRAVLLILLAELLFATMGATVKAAASTLPFEMLVFARNLAGLAVVGILVWRMRTPLRTHRRTLPLHLMRTALGLTAMYCMFVTLEHLPLANAVLLKMTAPLFVPLFAALWVGESTGRGTAWALTLGFVGVMIVLRPAGDWSAIAMIGVLGGAAMAMAKVSVRRLTRSEPVMRIVFYFALFATLLSALPLPWRWQTPVGHEWWLLLGLGVFGTAAQLLVTQALRHSHATAVAPLSYASLLFGGLLGYLFWDEVPGPAFIGGAGLVVLAGLLVVHGARRAPAARALIKEG